MAKRTQKNDEPINENLAENENDVGTENLEKEVSEDMPDNGETQADLKALEEDLSEDFDLPYDQGDEPVEEKEQEERKFENEIGHDEKRTYRNRLLPDGIEAQDRVEIAGKRAKRRLYKQESVMTEDGLVKIKRANTLRNKEYLELSASAKTGSVLKGKLTARRETPNGMVLAEVQYGENFIVRIPAEYMFDMSLQPIREIREEKEEGENENANAIVKNLINRHMNSIVNFIVLNVKEKDGIAYGSHLHALAKTAREFYVKPQRDQMPAVSKGMIVRAQVVQVNKIGLWIEALGAECFIRQDEIDWLRRSDISELYHVGDTVDVRVLDIKPHDIEIGVRNERKLLRSVTISASIKQTRINPNQKYFEQFDLNATGQGEVTQVTETGIFIIFADKISVLCRLYDGPKQPTIGSTVLAQITDKRCNPEAGEYHFFGVIKYIIKEKEL